MGGGGVYVVAAQIHKSVQVTHVKGGDHVVKLLAFCPPRTVDLPSCHGQESGGLRLYLRFLHCPLADWQSVVI